MSKEIGGTFKHFWKYRRNTEEVLNVGPSLSSMSDMDLQTKGSKDTMSQIFYTTYLLKLKLPL